MTSMRSAQPAYMRGEAAFKTNNIKRYRYLLVRTTEKVWLDRQKSKARLVKDAEQLKQSTSVLPYVDPRDPRPAAGVVHDSCLFSLYSNPNSTLKWAPRDALEHASSSLEEWRSHGYGSYQLLLSVIGANTNQRDLLRTNKFTWIGYSYFNLSFDCFAKLLRELDPRDRTFCFMIPLGVPVHMYFDIDGDFGEFPDLVGQDEACLHEFVSAVRSLFLELFGREMDCSGLTLLQATSATKLSWHLHVQSEGFRDVHHMKQFVLQLNRKLREKKDTLLYRNGKSLVDPAPYMDRQNFRAPYCSKPNKTALLPRGFSRTALNQSGSIRLKEAGAAAELHAHIDESLLWRCHPALAQPGPGYVYLELQDDAKLRKGSKRKSTDTSDVLTTSNRARKLESVMNAASASRRAEQSSSSPACAMAGSDRVTTPEEDELVKTALRMHLGSAVELDSCTFYRSIYGGHAVICGVCRAGSAQCLTHSAALGSHAIHRKNRVAFSLQGPTSTITARCFKCDQGKLGHRLAWSMSDADYKMLSVARPSNESDGTTICASHSLGSADEANDSMMVDGDEAKAGESNPAGAEPMAAAISESGLALSLQENVIACIRSVLSRHPVAEVFSASKSASCRQHEARCRKQRADEIKLFKELMMEDAVEGSVDLSHEQLCARFCAFKERVETLQAAQPSTWLAVRSICERYLDLSQVDVFNTMNDQSHIALESGQGSNKTGLLLSMLLVLLLRNPKLRVLILSNRVTYANTVRERSQQFDQEIAATFGVSLGFRSYTEDAFRCPKQASPNAVVDELASVRQERLRHQDSKINAANRRLVAVPRLIMSPQSLHRLFAATTEFGAPIVPYYDVIIPDEFMELLGMFHGSTMAGKRRLALEHWTSLMTRAQRVWVADANFRDEMALPMLGWLTGGKPFVKLQNHAKTLTRVYHRYDTLAQWRMQLCRDLQDGKRVFVVCNTKRQVDSVINDPDITSLNIKMKGLHSKSVKQDRLRFINSVQSWDTLQLLVISPVISHGVNFDKVHFDRAYLYGSDNSTSAVQTFQQLNRVRQICDNEVHLFIDAHPHVHQHLPCDYGELKAWLNEQVKRYHGDWFSQNITQVYARGDDCVPMPLISTRSPAPPGLVQRSDCRSAERENNYILDSKVDPVTCVRSLFDSPGNELYLRNQVEINQSRVNYERELLHQIVMAGGTVLSVQLKEADMDFVKEHGASIRKTDQVRKEAEFASILAAADLDHDSYIEMKTREKRHALENGDLQQLTKAEWKLTYGIPLEDITRLNEIEDFPARFGTDKRLRQFRNLMRLTALSPPKVAVSKSSDPVAYLLNETMEREHLTHVLRAVGFSGEWWDDSTIIAAQQVARLQPGGSMRLQAIQGWESSVRDPAFPSWWKTWKKKHDWKVDSGELYASDGSPVDADSLFKAFLTGCRQHLDSHLGFSIRSGRLSRNHEWGRSYAYSIDRSRWKDVGEAVKIALSAEMDKNDPSAQAVERLETIAY